jgi:hypothetical protein
MKRDEPGGHREMMAVVNAVANAQSLREGNRLTPPAPVAARRRVAIGGSSVRTTPTVCSAKMAGCCPTSG